MVTSGRSSPLMVEVSCHKVEQIDNHHVFAAIFWVVAEPLGDLLVFGGGAAARRGSLHGLGDDAACGALLFHAEEQFGRKAEEVPAGQRVQKCAVGYGLAPAQTGVEGRGSPRPASAQGEGEVELVDVAGADPLMDRVDAFTVLLLGEAEDDGGGGLDWLVGSRSAGAEFREMRRICALEGSLGVIKHVALRIDAKPCQRLARLGGAHCGGGFEVVAALVGEKPRGEVT